jgi:hypothetical protein
LYTPPVKPRKGGTAEVVFTYADAGLSDWD